MPSEDQGASAREDPNPRFESDERTRGARRGGPIDEIDAERSQIQNLPVPEIRRRPTEPKFDAAPALAAGSRIADRHRANPRLIVARRAERRATRRCPASTGGVRGLQFAGRVSPPHLDTELETNTASRSDIGTNLTLPRIDHGPTVHRKGVVYPGRALRVRIVRGSRFSLGSGPQEPNE